MSDPYSASGDGGTSLSDLLTTMQQGVRAMNQLTAAIRETFPNWTAVPSTASSAGTAGQVAYDATHFYVCIATNTWVRCTLATF